MVTSKERSNGSNAHLNEAATPGPSEDWLSETDIIYPMGSNKIMLTVQRPLLKAVFQDAFKRIHAAMVFHNTFPNAYQTVEMITESLITAAELNDRATNIHNCLIVDGDYSTIMTRLVSTWLPNMKLTDFLPSHALVFLSSVQRLKTAVWQLSKPSSWLLLQCHQLSILLTSNYRITTILSQGQIT